jgi:malonate-semialdehyde dehydrogenase (acetylating)/methylmalonate-semialdehyde dehydrogenase
MGPVITAQSQQRIESLIQTGADEGATVLVDGRQAAIPDLDRATSSNPRCCKMCPPRGNRPYRNLWPGVGLMHVNTVDEAIALVNQQPLGQHGLPVYQ